MTERANGKDIGRGLEFVARKYTYEIEDERHDRVLKKTYYPFYDRTDIPFGERMMQRAKEDIQLIENYFGSELVGDSRVVERFGKWYISQPYFGENRLTNNCPEIEAVRPNLEKLFKLNDQMTKETGFTLDVFGFDFWKELPKYLTDPDYWSMQSFRVVETENGHELRLVDTGLLWTSFDTLQEKKHINIHEPPTGWTVSNFLIPIIKKRIGLDNGKV